MSNGGYCTEGERCVCGGDLPAIRATCQNFRRATWPSVDMQQENHELGKRIEELEAALKPFAKAGELFKPRPADSYNESVYAPAAGPEYNITGDDLRRAREAMRAD